MAVVPDGGGEGEQSLGDSRGDAREGAPAVQLEVEMALEGVMNRLDELADRRLAPLGSGGASPHPRRGRATAVPPPCGHRPPSPSPRSNQARRRDGGGPCPGQDTLQRCRRVLGRDHPITLLAAALGVGVEDALPEAHDTGSGDR
jgi:hypothetical protein